MNSETNDIRMLLEQKKSQNRKNISINIDENLLSEIDCTLEKIGKVTDTFCSRNTFIEVAAREYMSSLKQMLDNSNFSTKDSEQMEDQVIIFTAAEKTGNYKSMFLNNYWSCVQLGAEVIELIYKRRIKYFALYQGRPKQFIDSFAEIQSINKLENGKYEFKLAPIQYLSQPVLLGKIQPASLMKGKRTTILRLLNAKTIDQL